MTTPRILFTSALFSLCLLTGSAMAQNGGDTLRGASLAASWCSTCHTIDRRGTGNVVDHAPAFPTIAANPDKSDEYLRHWLMSKHPQMPDFKLGYREVKDLVAYIRSLAPSE